MTLTVAIETHGCKLNQAESDALSCRLTEVGYRVVELADCPDIYILNTCTVTHVADSKARQALRAARRAYPDMRVIAVGCYSKRASEELLRVGDIAVVPGTAGDIQRILDEIVRVAEAGDIEMKEHDSTGRWALGTRTRAFVKIQEGCRYKCAYCIVPLVRGRPVSVPDDDVVADVRRCVSEGYREVVLTGTQPGCYGFDLAGTRSLASLVARLLEETTIERLRVSSLQPQELTSDLLKLWKNQRLCPHIHMPLQSGSNAVLRRMGRGYSIDEYLQAVNAFREHVSGSAVSTDILVGFPGESEPDFEECVSVSCSVGFSKVHVFPFSSRPGTRAYMMQHSVSPADLSARVHRMLAVSRTLEARFCQSMVGQVRPVLWEEQQRVGGILMWSGLTDNYVRVHTRSKACLANRIVLAELVEARAGVLWARTVSDIP